MAISKGRDITDIAADVSIMLSDPNQRRWSSTLLITFMNQAIRLFAVDKALSRDDIHVPTVGQSYFATLAELRGVAKVDYNNKPLAPRNIARMNRDHGSTWRTAANGAPRYYIPSRAGLTIWPAPDTAGTALVFTGSPDITETGGGQITGDQYNGSDDSGTVVHWLPGDGEVSNEEADNNLRISYHWIPRPSASGDSIPGRYEEAIKAYAMWQAVAISDAPEEKIAAATFFQDWLIKKSDVMAMAHDDASGDDLLGGTMEAT